VRERYAWYHVDILVNNVGILLALPYDHSPADRVDDILAVNLRAPVALLQAFAPGMVQRHAGRIITVASLAGQIGHPDIWYGITKAGVMNTTKSFAKLLVSRVNTGGKAAYLLPGTAPIS